MSRRRNWHRLKTPLRFDGHSTVIMPTRPTFCIDISSMPKEAVVENNTVAFAVTCPMKVGQLEAQAKLRTKEGDLRERERERQRERARDRESRS